MCNDSMQLVVAFPYFTVNFFYKIKIKLSATVTHNNNVHQFWDIDFFIFMIKRKPHFFCGQRFASQP